jgi:Cysteine rich repeat
MIYSRPLVLSMIFTCALAVQAAFAMTNERPCRADIEKFCPNVKPGDGRVVECLRKHHEELPPTCRSRGQEVRERVQEAHEACQGDIAKYCKEVRPGEGHILACLKKHDKDLSAACKDAMKPTR